MNMIDFKSFVQSNADLLHGVHPESQESLEKCEAALGFSLPDSMKCLLSTHGYSPACGVDNIEDSVQITLDCRASIHLPKNVLIINDSNDGGVVYAIADETPLAEYATIWGDACDLHDLGEGKPLPENNERFQSFAAWIVDRVQFERNLSGAPI